ncbi:recombination-associated protein RdgC [Marinobacter sp. MBR-105]
MLFKNVRVYKLKPEFSLSLSDLEEAVAKKPARECQNLEMEYLGFDYVFTGSRLRVLPVENERVFYLRLCLSQRICPNSVINKELGKRVRKIEKDRGEPVRKKEKKELKEQVKAELIVKAYQKESFLQVIIDFDRHQVWVDQASNKKAEAPLSLLRKVLGSFPVTPLSADGSLAPFMKSWVLDEGTLPDNWALGTDAKLVDEAEEKASVTVKFEDLTDQDILALLAHRSVVELALCNNDTVNFKLHEDGTIKSIKPLVKPEPTDSNNRADLFDAELYYTLAELRQIIGKIAPLLSADDDTQSSGA